MSTKEPGAESPRIEGRADLVNWLAAGEKDPNDWRIGTEHEKFVFRLGDLSPVGYEGDAGIRALMEAMTADYGWEPIREGETTIALKRDSAGDVPETISLEPGGQFELSGAPLATLHETCAEAGRHLSECLEIGERLGIGFLGVGFSPTWRLEEIPTMPKKRYAVMTRYMPEVGSRGHDMMYRTCTIQVNLDFASEADMVKKLRVSLALQPVATALFANSPFIDGAPNGHKSWRSRVWRDLDPDRTGMLPFVFEDGFGFERWVDYALDVPMYFVYRDGRYIDALGQSFRDFMKGRLPALPGEVPTLSDWADHLTTLFPEARIKKYIEMRGADGGPWRRLCALPAFWVGLMYDQGALDAAWDLVKDWDAETREALRVEASVHALDARVGGIHMHALARDVLDLAAAGLTARGRAGADGLIPDEAHFLSALKDSVESGKVPADELLDHYRTDWAGDLTRIYAEYSY